MCVSVYLCENVCFSGLFFFMFGGVLVGQFVPGFVVVRINIYKCESV